MGKNRLFILIGCVWLGVIALTACAPADRPAPATDTPAALPDLAPLYMSYTLENSQCLEPGAALGVRLTVTNAGSAPTGAFTVRVNDEEQSVTAGLAAGDDVSLFFSSYAEPSQAEVDAAGMVAESDETNNILEMRLPVPTPPLPCTPTPSAHYLPSLFDPA